MPATATHAEPPRAAPPRWPQATAHAFKAIEDVVRGRGDPFAGTELDPAPEFFQGQPLTERAVFDLAGAGEDPWPPEPGADEAEPAGEHGAYDVVPEPEPEAAPPDAAPEPEYREADIIWFPTPPTLDGLVKFGFVHTATQCPVLIFRALDEHEDWVELAGSHEGMEDLANFVAYHTQALVCMAKGIMHGPQPLRGPALMAG